MTTALLMHHLISLDVIPQRLRMHAYLICDDRSSIENAVNLMVGKAEEAVQDMDGGFRFLPIVLDTILTGECRKTVREIVGKTFPEAKKTMSAAKRYHLTVWMWDTDNPDDERLMELH